MEAARPEPSAHQVGDFVLRRWLAQGGMAELYLATRVDPTQPSEVVVLKRVLPQFSRSEKFVRMFSREARLASILRHPNIVQVHEAVGLGAGDCFFTMEFIHGVDLGVLLDTIRDRRGGALPLAQALTIAVAICKGLHHAHDACTPEGQPLGIVHRDVSPSNVLIGFDGSVKVTDFGVAKALAMTQLTEEGTRKGKLSYMSPEQAKGDPVDRKADVFAIAVVLYELSTMERLFDGDNDLAVMYNILHRDRPSPRDKNPGYPAALESIVLRGVSHDMDERYSTALELQRALEGFAAEVGLELSVDALAKFVRSTVPVPLHPGEDPRLRAESIAPRSGPPQAVTVMEANGTNANPGGSAPGVSAPLAQASMPAGLISNPHGLVDPSSRLHLLSAGLAVAALLMVVGVGAMVWMAGKAPDAPPTEPSAPAEDAAAAAPLAPEPTTPLAPVVAPPPVVTPRIVESATPEPSVVKAPRGKKKSKKKRASVPEPAPPPTPVAEPVEPASSPPSKKPSPTDTLLPIRE